MNAETEKQLVIDLILSYNAIVGDRGVMTPFTRDNLDDMDLIDLKSLERRLDRLAHTPITN